MFILKKKPSESSSKYILLLNNREKSLESLAICFSVMECKDFVYTTIYMYLAWTCMSNFSLHKLNALTTLF